MTDYLILVRTDPSANPDGDMVLFAVSADSSETAAKALAIYLPVTWRVEKVVGPAQAGLSEFLRLHPGEVRKLTR